MTEAPAESVTDTETETSAEPTEQPAAEAQYTGAHCRKTATVSGGCIDGTSISYPVMYISEEPQKYLRRSFLRAVQLKRSAVSGRTVQHGRRQPHHLRSQHEKRHDVLRFEEISECGFLDSPRTEAGNRRRCVSVCRDREVRRTNTADPWYDRTTCENGRHLIPLHLLTRFVQGRQVADPSRRITAERKTMLSKKKPKILTPEQAEEIRTKDFFDMILPGSIKFFPTIILSATATAACGRCGNIRRPLRNRPFSRSLPTATA